MQKVTHASIQTIHEVTAPKKLKVQYPPLEQVNKPNLKTEEAAYYLNRRPQTLRGWACLENGPIRPRRIGGLLAWPTAGVKELAGLAA